MAADAWDAIAGASDPFSGYAFLSALEASGSVGQDAGWLPLHVTAFDGDELLGAIPLYAKAHSYGEYIFDWAWADAAMRIGVPYYPKLVAMPPFTPATGSRFLVREGADRKAVLSTLFAGVRDAGEVIEASSIHLLFLSTQERQEAIDAGFMPRLTMQYHFRNPGYGDFGDYLGAMRASARKQVRKERRVVAEAGFDIEHRLGPELDPSTCRTIDAMYRDTCYRKGSHPYLSPGFFERLIDNPAALVVLARREDQIAAMSLSFEKGECIFGRYWGCREDSEFLHFELCYYQLIERAIRRGAVRFEAGAQGRHKLKRGLMPSPVHSAHWIRHPVLQTAVAEFLPREAFAIQQSMAEQSAHGPFKEMPKEATDVGVKPTS